MLGYIGMEKGSFAATRCHILTKQTANQVMTGEKYIGVMLDNKLSFNQHIDEIVNKTRKLLNQCRRNLHMCNQYKPKNQPT